MPQVPVLLFTEERMSEPKEPQRPEVPAQPPRLVDEVSEARRGAGMCPSHTTEEGHSHVLNPGFCMPRLGFFFVFHVFLSSVLSKQSLLAPGNGEDRYF